MDTKTQTTRAQTRKKNILRNVKGTVHPKMIPKFAVNLLILKPFKM